MEYTLYKISCLDLNIDFLYIGSTKNYTRRKCAHKNVCNNINANRHNLKVYETIRNNGGWDNWMMNPIEILITDKIGAHMRENVLMMEYKATLNLRKASTGLTKKDYNQEYRVNNKDYFKEYRNKNKDIYNDYIKEYRNKNKDILKAKRKEINICICGCQYTQPNYNRHCKTIKHLEFIKNQVV